MKLNGQSVSKASEIDGWHNISESEKLKKDLLWGQYLEYRTHARHSETLRSNVINYLMVASSGLITVIALGKGIEFRDLPLAILLIIIGAVGVVFSAAYTERYYGNNERAAHIRYYIDALFFKGQVPFTLGTIREEANICHRTSKINRFIDRYSSTHWLWMVFPILITTIGIILSVAAFFADLPKYEAL